MVDICTFLYLLFVVSQLVVCTFNVLADGLSGKHPNWGGFVLTPQYCLDFDYCKNRSIKQQPIFITIRLR